LTVFGISLSVVSTVGVAGVAVVDQTIDRVSAWSERKKTG